MLLLNSSAVTGAASASELATAMEEAMLLYEEGKFSMPLRLHSEHGERTLLVMPVQTDDWTGVKLAILNPDNPRCGLPVLHGLMTLFDGRTGKPLALLDAAVLTGSAALRPAGHCRRWPARN
jgi:ornithine cyclodeaminase/alanine dehydrogenase-like protein (mu-crystallin family)